MKLHGIQVSVFIQFYGNTARLICLHATCGHRAKHLHWSPGVCWPEGQHGLLRQQLVLPQLMSQKGTKNSEVGSRQRDACSTGQAVLRSARKAGSCPSGPTLALGSRPLAK